MKSNLARQQQNIATACLRSSKSSLLNSVVTLAHSVLKKFIAKNEKTCDRNDLNKYINKDLLDTQNWLKILNRFQVANI